jgi:hypothetical protein
MPNEPTTLPAACRHGSVADRGLGRKGSLVKADRLRIGCEKATVSTCCKNLPSEASLEETRERL